MPVTAFTMPPRPRNAAGEERRVGFELELAGLHLPDVAAVVRDLFGGRVVQEESFGYRVEGTTLGDFQVAADAQVLHDQKYLQPLEKLGVPTERPQVERPVEKVVEWVAELVVPFEVTMPPLPLGRLAAADTLRAGLAARGARGTTARLRYAFGLHVNAEAPDTDRITVLRHLQAFLALYEPLREASRVDLARSLSPYIDPFPDAYRELVLAPDYDPPLERLAADYLAHNPTRNRPLDLLPLLVHRLGDDLLAELPGKQQVRARPAFHYRLPNCRIDEPEWTVAEEWNRWVEVERLADRPDELAAVAAEVRAGSPGGAAGLWERLKARVR
ncbi:MAG TPA: amidoligase family protein [Thermoanaerobaculia bacterium]|nr:amidoligase family protein [Thermoanaerobaculia bacterium]